jgi:hypothetical protein
MNRRILNCKNDSSGRSLAIIVGDSSGLTQNGQPLDWRLRGGLDIVAARDIEISKQG